MAAEGFIQFIWKHRLYIGNSLSTTCGQPLEILQPGEQNSHAGPDFFNARIKMDQMVWAGNVEVHRRASDWYSHRHHLDPAYNNVILHVVGEYDTDVTNSRGRRIQTMVPDYPENLVRRYDVLKRSENWLPCADYIKGIPVHKQNVWLSSLQAERVAQKGTRIEQILNTPALSLDEALYMTLASGYGLPVNTLPFELLAKGIPFSFLIDHRDSLQDLESILFGHSGMLFPARELGPYPSSLWNRYTELKDSIPEKPLPRHLWRFLRLRPASFPTLRISQFASLIHNCVSLTENILGTNSMAEMELIFRTGASEYWNGHYLFGRCSPLFPKFPGEQFISTLIINVLVPFLYALDKNGDKSMTGIRASEILIRLKAESNQLIRKWASIGIRPNNAMESQALLQLYNVYCKQKRCLDCQIGADSIKAAIHEKK
ncbi:MAG: DUF2851 family protein [Bacteroidales bacterium]|nr:DUF2851 family protein [Bacteroidales bacterium]